MFLEVGDLMSITGKRLRALRERKGMSQEAVADYLGISRTAYNKYESGVIKPVRKLERLAQLFGVSADYILGREDSTVLVSGGTEPGVEQQIKKYIGLSRGGKDIVDITLDAVYQREKDSSKGDV